MIIPVNGVDSLEEYLKKKNEGLLETRPKACPACWRAQSFWVHGSYVRRVLDCSGETDVKIDRYLCGGCGLVVSCVFTCLAPYVRFSPSIIARGIQEFSEEETTYCEEATELSDINSEAPPEAESITGVSVGLQGG
jgi:ribosomal protein S27AE